MNQIRPYLIKGFFAAIKRHLCLTKGNLDYPEKLVEVESSLTGSCFWDFWFKSRKVFFSKRALFNETSDPQTLFLSKIGPVICKATTTKVNFRFYQQRSQAATRIICKQATFPQMLVSFFSSIIPLYIENTPWKNYVRFWKWNLKRTPQSAQNSFSRKSNLKFCIIFNMISFANVQGSVNIRLAYLACWLITLKVTNISFLKKVGVLMFS